MCRFETIAIYPDCLAHEGEQQRNPQTCLDWAGWTLEELGYASRTSAPTVGDGSVLSGKALFPRAAKLLATTLVRRRRPANDGVVQQLAIPGIIHTVRRPPATSRAMDVGFRRFRGFDGYSAPAVTMRQGLPLLLHAPKLQAQGITLALNLQSQCTWALGANGTQRPLASQTLRKAEDPSEWE